MGTGLYRERKVDFRMTSPHLIRMLVLKDKRHNVSVKPKGSRIKWQHHGRTAKAPALSGSEYLGEGRQHATRRSRGNGTPWGVRTEHMKVFLSWSKEPSQAIAAAMHTWLQDVIQSLDPWMSDQDIQSGERWAATIGAELQNHNFGILVLTAENQLEPWINFEAGALSKMIGTSRVVPYLFGFTLPNLSAGPLTQFHGREATEEGTRRLMEDINGALPKPLSEAQLEKAFKKNWPDLQARLEKIAHEDQKRRQAQASTPARTDGNKLDELLVLVRGMAVNPSDRAMKILEARSSADKLMAERITTLAGFAKALALNGISTIPLETIVDDTVKYRMLVPLNGAAFERAKTRIAKLAEEMLLPGTEVEVVGPPSTRIPSPGTPQDS